MGRKKRTNKHGAQQNQKKRGVNLPPPTGKLYWHDGYWTDSRWSLSTTRAGADEIRRDWKNFEWVKQTTWYKEKMANNELEKH